MTIRKVHNEMMVGLFVILGFVMLSLMVFFVSGVYIFRAGYKVNIMYDYVDILDKGAPVRMAGVRVGEVSKVDLVFDEQKQHLRVRVKLFIEKAAHIRENYFFEIRGAHILSEPHIEITPKPGNAPELKDNAEIEGVPMVPLEDLIKHSHQIAKNLDQLVSAFSENLGDAETMASMKKLIVHTANLTESMDKVLNAKTAEELQESLKNIKASSDAMNEILQHTREGEGTVGNLLMKDELYKDMSALVKDVKAHPWKLLKKDGRSKFLGIF